MSTQPCSSMQSTTALSATDTNGAETLERRPEWPKFQSEAQQEQLTTEQTEQPRANPVLDGPWKVVRLAEGDKLPPGVIAGPEPHLAKSLPWRRGDVTRLTDDTPEGMMRYIATHTSGWWQEMAERALRDTETANRMAEELGILPGQHWTIELDTEVREKQRAAEEARRAREEAERAKEESAREAFARRQMELLEKAGRAPRCEYVYADGRGCRAPQVRGERWCHGHAKTMSYRPEQVEILPMEDENAVMVNLYRVTKSLLSGKITEKVAGLALWSIAIGAPGVERVRKPGQARRKNSVIGKSGDRVIGKQNTHREGAETRRIDSRELTRTNKTNPGVTRRKSFKSGVEVGGTPGMETSGTATRQQPRVGGEIRSAANAEIAEKQGVNPLKSTDLHRCSQGRTGGHGKYNGIRSTHV